MNTKGAGASPGVKGGVTSRSSSAGSGTATKSKPSSGTKPSTKSSGSSQAPRSGQSSKVKEKISQRLNPKTVNPFGSDSKPKSAFATLYSNGGVPCRLIHGSVKHKLAWKPDPEDVPFDPVLIALAEGVRETVHPYMFVAREGFKELLYSRGASEKAIPLVPKLIQPIRLALASSDVSVFEAGLDALVHLSKVTGPALNAHLKTVLVSVGKRSMDKKYKEKIADVLQQLECNGGREAVPLIKARIPTYQSVSL